MRVRFLVTVCLAVATVLPMAVRAADLPYPLRQAVVWVHCGDRQGSGVVVNPAEGYVLTNAHILLDLDTMRPDTCEVGFIDGGVTPEIFYAASWVRYAFEQETNRDVAILKIGLQKQRMSLPTFPWIPTDEFSEVGDAISIVGYPGVADGTQTVTSGVITGLERGIVKSDAPISPGVSGGAGISASNGLVGLATRILYREISPGVEEVVDYELVDIRAVLSWMDTYGEDEHDLYVTHLDAARYHAPTEYVTEGTLACEHLARSPLESTVFCLRDDGTRNVFPNAATYHSWFSDFTTVVMAEPEQLAGYRLVANVTMKPGSLVKIESDPKVYLVTDDIGTLRWIQTEERAIELLGHGWAGFVTDIPVSFFASYRLGSPIP
ncbi:serine protease [Candidatus Uhrbacteria bacterium]|nr:serine protease [Candidatus Uhrbacteria bacterium]